MSTQNNFHGEIRKKNVDTFWLKNEVPSVEIQKVKINHGIQKKKKNK